MSLKSETLNIDGVAYQVNELPVKVLLPLSNRLAENDLGAQFELIGNSVAVNGALLGSSAGDLGSSVYMKLMQLVLKVHGLGGSELGNGS